MQKLQGVITYDPIQTKCKLRFPDGFILEPYGYDLGEQLWFEDGSIYLKVRTTSSFTPELIETILKYDTNEVVVELSSEDPNINGILSQFDGMNGEVKIARVGLRSTSEIPSTLIQIELNSNK